MKSKPYIVFIFLSCTNLTWAQEKFTISGTIQDSSNGESMIGATVTVKGTTTGTTSNVYGFYSLTLPQGNHVLVVSFISYASKEITIDLNQNITQNLTLEEESTKMEEVVVLAEDLDKNVFSTELSVTKLEMKELKRIPALLGEVDVVRSIQLTPGISTVGEGAAGFNVRGGSIDQNLILLDEAPVYNSSHLLGFFSVFNPDAVKDIKLLKAGIPAQYGGRLSSLLDVRMKEGNSKKFEASGGIGLISSRLTIEAPIVKDKSSFIIAARRSYVDLFLPLSADKQINQSILYFYDISGKVNFKLNPKNTIFLSGYFGRDVFGLGKSFRSGYGNSTGTFRWNHIFSSKLFANFTAIFSNYDYSVSNPEGSQAFEWKSNIINYSLKADFSYFASPKSSFNFGGQSIYYTLNPAKVEPKSANSIYSPFELPQKQAIESALYIDHEYKITDKLSLQYGIRFSTYTLLGKGTFYDYVGEAGQRLSPSNPKTYSSNQAVNTYNNFEPRISVRYALNNLSSLKASYNRSVQYIHLISNSIASSPTDVWTISTNNIKPQMADQFTLGYFRNFKENMFETSIEVYYKDIFNQIDYINGANLLLNRDLEAELLYGIGRSYGVELSVKKNTGKLTGWLSYTLSKTETKVNGINNNEWYNAKFDKTHNLSIVGMYKLNKRWSLSANFVYATGVVSTFPNSRYQLNDTPVVPYNASNQRNNFRVPAYHRLDIGAILEGKETGKRWHSQWVFSIYNVYGQANPFTIFFRQNEDNPNKTEAVRLSVFANIIPSVTYNFKF